MIVIGCGKSKLGVEAEARELYTGSLFVAARRYAEASGRPWAILSAEHGFVLPTTRLAPYDRKLGLKGPALAEWASRAAQACVVEVDRLSLTVGSGERKGGLVEVLAGHPYAWPFRCRLLDWDIRSTEPLEGLGLGARLHWLKFALVNEQARPAVSA